MNSPTSPASTFYRYTLPVLLWAVVILLLSGSGFHSGFTYGLVSTAVPLFVPDISVGALQGINTVVRKLAHVTEYFLLALLLWRALRREAAERWEPGWAGVTLAVGVLLAGLDELRQVFTPRRTGLLVDVGLDTLGVLLALLLLYARARRGVRHIEQADSSLRPSPPPGPGSD